MPTLFTSASELRHWRSLLGAGTPLAFVPTMGALHAGHERLMREARSMASTVIVSVFVNPMQFGDQIDLSQYPRTLDADIESCMRNGVDVIFAPTTDQIYPSNDVQIVSSGKLGTLYEGESRPGHFEGVITVVNRLFCLVAPTVAVFGEKDYQQLTLIRQMAATLHPNVQIRNVQTVRDPDGLAISSRNSRLTPKNRLLAIKLYESLHRIEVEYKSGVTDTRYLEHFGIEYLEQFPDIDLDYIVCVNATTLDHIDSVNQPSVVLLAATIGGVRLIDNVLLTPLLEN